MSVKLEELNPSHERNGKYTYLSFDCPCGDDSCKRRVRGLPCVPNGVEGQGTFWQMDGEPPDWDSITLHPSVNFLDEHWHGFITKGEIK
jgi:hypothetical protein